MAKTIEEQKEYMRKWREDNKEHRKEYQREWQKKNREHRKAYEKEFRKTHPEIVKEWDRLDNKPERRKRNAIRSKDKKVAIKDKCSQCGALKELEIHHKLYIAAGAYIILCHKCHQKIHNGKK